MVVIQQLKNCLPKKSITYADEIGCDISYTNKKITSCGVAWNFDCIADTFGK